MRKGLTVLLIVILLSVLFASVAFASEPDRGDPVGGCPNANWSLQPLKYADPDQVALDKNLDGWLCVKKNPWTRVLYYIDNKY